MAGSLGGNSNNGSFELDLAPLLSIIMKLVPALILSSVFLQVTIIETDLPQAVKDAVAIVDDKPKATVLLSISVKEGLKLTVAKGAEQKVHTIPVKGGKFDLELLHATLRKVKLENPEVFRIEFEPEPEVSFQEIVKIMDEARKSHDKKVTFPLFDKQKNAEIRTEYMFPDVVFSNVFEG